MVSIFYNDAKKEIFDNTLNMSSDTLKIMLTNSTHVPDADDSFIDDAGADDAIDGEIVATNYTGGFAGAGRKTLASVAITVDKTNDRAELDATDVTWTALGNGSNDTITGAVMVKEITNDTLSRVIAFIDFTDTTTNGGDFTIQWDPEGILHLT